MIILYEGQIINSDALKADLLLAEAARNVFEPYDSEKKYVPNNKVVYQGESYLNISESTGVFPTNADYWLKITQAGATPTFSAGTATTGDVGTDFTFTLTGEPPNYVLNLTVPKGAGGQDGQDGQDGTSYYVHIRYGTSAMPEELLTTPNDYMGIYAGTSDTAPTMYSGYAWYKIVGEDGASYTVEDTSTNLAMNGTAAIGTSEKIVYSDHVHPSDTNKLSLSGGTMTGALTAQNNTSYTTAQARNIKFDTEIPSSLANGEICFVYETE